MSKQPQNYVSQVAGAAKNGGTPLEAAVTPPTPPPVTETATESQSAAAATSPTPTLPASAELRPSAHSNRKPGGTGGTTSSKSSANREFQFFFEDEVFHIDRKGRVCFGIVTGTAESYSSDDEEEEVNDVLGKGDVRVAFYPEGKEIVRTEKSVSGLRLCNCHCLAPHAYICMYMHIQYTIYKCICICMYSIM